MKTNTNQIQKILNTKLKYQIRAKTPNNPNKQALLTATQTKKCLCQSQQYLTN